MSVEKEENSSKDTCSIDENSKGGEKDDRSKQRLKNISSIATRAPSTISNKLKGGDTTEKAQAHMRAQANKKKERSQLSLGQVKKRAIMG